jgi:hypothetical protein
MNGRVLERGWAHVAVKRVHEATGAGDINKSSPLLVICQSLFQISSLSQYAQRALQGIVVSELGP